jgi:hypothetical protein
MRKQTLFMLLIAICAVSLVLAAAPGTLAQTGQTSGGMHMKITGEIAKMENGYIIRGKTPAEVFTILNPEPKILDRFVKSGKTVHLEVKSVSGDNVEIEKIDGKSYGKTKKMGK